MSFGQIAFAIGMIASGALNLINRNFYGPWDPLPPWVPLQLHAGLAYASGAIMVLGGVGLATPRVAAVSARALAAYILLFLVLLKFPILLAQPGIENNWLSVGEIAVILAGAIALGTTTDRSFRAARYLMGAALIPIGISHFTYLDIATPMVPAVLPFRPAWVIFTGVAHIAAGLALLAGIYVRLAIILEASMISAFAFLVWLAPALTAPHDASRWDPFIVTIAVAGGVWAVASKMPPRPT